MNNSTTNPQQSSNRARLFELLQGDPALGLRLHTIHGYARKIRASEYHVTNACNIRCQGCWFFQYEFDKETKDEKEPAELVQFIARERERGINTALLIGGEPTLFPERVAAYVKGMENVTISTNGLKVLPKDGFERVQVAITLFGGGELDDELRAIKPNGSRFSGLFDTALQNYKDDPRVTFIYAITEEGVQHIEPTVRRIRDNGNVVTFNFYSEYHKDSLQRHVTTRKLLDEALRVRALYPETVLSTPYYIKAIISGETEWGKFGYDVCPSISVDHPAHRERLQNGKRTLPLFNAYAPDLKTVNFCCTSGRCENCRDSQAVFSWLLVSAEEFFHSLEGVATWVEIAESYWAQFVWSPFHRSKRASSAPTSVLATA